MRILILAAGYGTRLYPLTKDKPKALLPIGKKPLIDFLIDKLRRVKDLKEIVVVTNEKFSPVFQAWAKNEKKLPLSVLNDGTTTPENRLGAIGDVNFAINQKRIDDDVLILGSDNLFDDNLGNFLNFAATKSPKATIGLYDIQEKEKAKIYGVVELDRQAKVVSFEEKPKSPKSSLIGMCLYYLPRDSLHCIRDYLKQSKSADTTGDYVKWLSTQDDVYGFKFSGKWYDIGSLEEYEKAKNDFGK